MGGGWKVTSGAPVVGQHYPRTPPEFEKWFDDEDDARAYLTDVRFRDGFNCPTCAAPLALGGPRGMWCQKCRRHLSVTAGTLMDSTKLPLRTWLAACWYVTQTKVGVSATGFADMYGLSYTSTWLLFHKVRSAMDQNGRDRLDGNIEMDETTVGGYQQGGSKVSSNKSTVLVAVEFAAGSMGRARLERAHSAGTLSIEAFIEEHIEPGSILFTDGNQAYVAAVNALASRGLVYKLNQVNQSKSTIPRGQLLPRVHKVISLMKRQQLGVFQGGIGHHNLDAYLDEYTFKFNRRRSGSRGLLFWRLVCGLTEPRPGAAVRYEELRGRKKASRKSAAAHAKAAAAHTRQMRATDANLQHRRQLARKRGEPEPVSPKQLRPELVHVEPDEPF